MNTELPNESVRSCPRLNWLKKPGEPIQWFRLEGATRRYEDDRWVPITAAEAYAIAERRDKAKARKTNP